ncbi:MAG: hypothetical protein NC429_06345 [Lachnospiraceae bacterium]|nr:hypothetical protein [Lachnospiraceae bacterium]
MNKKIIHHKKILLTWGLALCLCAVQLDAILPAFAAPSDNTAENMTDATSDIADTMLDASIDTADAIHISTVDDLRSFAENCSVDTWSVGKLILLDNDLQLNDTELSPIPSFGGTFLGQGHAISGFSLSGGSNHMGLFRYIQEEGAVYQLSVSGSAQAESSHSGLALLAGVNKGIIGNCHVSGTINGGEKSGGIAGINESTGIILDCSSSGSVCGKHLIGGIAGENLGSISGCQNHCDVNIIAEDNHIDLSSIDLDAALTDILTTENAASVTDIGGITGSNSGSVRACVNDGSVGYPHVGYNIGGIAGSQSGYIEGCINYGVLNGRKDIGGIAGQMEPSSRLQFDEDTLKKLNEEFHTLHDLLTKLDQDLNGSSSSLTGQIDQLLNSVEGAQNAVDNILTNASEDFSSFAEPTDLASLPSPKPVSLDFLDKLPSISPSPSPGESPTPSATPGITPDVTPTPTPEATPTPDVTPAPEATPTADITPAPEAAPPSDITSAPETSASDEEPAADTVSDQNPGKSAEMDDDANESETESSAQTRSYYPESLYAPRRIQSMILYAPAGTSASDAVAVPGDIPASDTAPIPGDTLTSDTVPVPGDIPASDTAPAQEEAPAPTATPEETPTPFPFPTLPADFNPDDYRFFEDIDREDVEKSINDAQTNIYEDASELLEGIQNRIQSHISIVGSRFDAAKNMLGSSFSAIISDTRLLNSMLDGENQVVLDDFQAVIDELNIITDLITDPDPADPDEILEDISDNDQLTDTTGKVMNSANKGFINGDLNAGGIAGSLSRENNFDPENDFDLDQYDTTLNFRYQERIVIRQCENSGKIEGKKDCVGGIAGEVLLGSIMECTNTGTVKTDGSLVGGIAGISTSTIRNCNSKCALWGDSKIGGIAGEGNSIYDCRSMIEIREGHDYLGSVAGIIDSAGEVENCFFVEGGPAGIDGISYTGHAQPLPYQEFLELPALPDLFENIYLTFEADGHTVSILTIAYGESFDPSMLPDVPKKEGFVGTWSSFNQEDITFDQTIEAVYTEYITTLESDCRDGSRPVLLAEGTFSPDDRLTASKIEAYPEDGLTNAVCYKFHVQSDGYAPYTFRMLIPTDMKNPQLEQLLNQTWLPLPSKQDGSYLVFTLDTYDAVVCCADRPATIPVKIIVLLVILLIVLLGALILFLLRRRKLQKKH